MAVSYKSASSSAKRSKQEVLRGSSVISDSDVVLSIVEGRGLARGEIGMASMDFQAPHLVLCQFSDTQVYNKLLAKIKIFKPAEVLISSTQFETDGAITKLVEKLKKEEPSLKIVPLQRKLFNESVGFQRIKELVASSYASVINLISQKYYCLAASAALLKYMEILHSFIFSTKSLKVEFQVCEKTCLIDYATAQHLELLQNNQNFASSHSLLGVLGCCQTFGGNRLLRMNILQPSCNLQLINQRLDCIDDLIQSKESLRDLHTNLGQLPIDIDKIIANIVHIPKPGNNRIVEQRLNNIIALKQTLEALPAIAKNLENAKNSCLSEFRELLTVSECQKILIAIKNVIHEEAEVEKGAANMKRQRCFAVVPQINPILDIARKAYCEVIQYMNNYVSDLSKTHNLPFRLEENGKRGFFVQCLLPNSLGVLPQLPASVLNLKRHKSMITFTTEVLLQCDRRVQEITEEILNLSNVVIASLCGEIRESISSLYRISEVISNLDVLITLANYSLTTLGCTRPHFSPEYTAITKGRHPILDHISSKPPTPSDTFLSTNTNICVVTGPNMSGKTTYMKQLASLQILAQIGSYVPAESATFRIATKIFSRIGTGDNIEGNASSFTLEMTEMSYILSNIDDSSVVVIDELGRATSVEEGAAISWALCEQFIKKKCFLVLASHFLFLTKLENIYYGVLNYQMETEENTQDVVAATSQSDNHSYGYKLKYTHVFTRGVTSVRNYGLKLTNQTSFPAGVAARAQKVSSLICQKKGSNHVGEITKLKSKLYLLSSHLKTAACSINQRKLSALRIYFKSLQKEYQTSYKSADPIQK